MRQPDVHVSAAIEQWLPHRPPFLFVDELRAASGGGGTCALRLAADDPRLVDGRLPPWLVLEALAQSIAACNGFGKTDGREEGMLVEIQDAELQDAARGGETVVLCVERRQSQGALVRFAAHATVGERTQVRALLTVARRGGD